MARTPKEQPHDQPSQKSVPQPSRQARNRPRKHHRHGEGSIYQRKDGRYVAALRVEGKRKVYYGKTYKEAQEKLQQALYEKKQGILATGPQQTLEQFLSHWMEHVQKPTVGLRTYVHERGWLYNHVIPVLGKVRMQQVTPEKLEMPYDLLQQEKNLKASSIRAIHATLHKVFDHAVRRNIIARNPCDLAITPQSGPICQDRRKGSCKSYSPPFLFTDCSFSDRLFDGIHFSRSAILKGLMKSLLIIKLEIGAQLRASFLGGAIIM